MALEKLLPSNLIIPAESFSADRLAKNAQDLGYAQAETLEALIWDYELYAQLQKRISGLCRLKGGAAVQLYVPIERQRASVDVDILTTIPQPEMQLLLEEVSRNYDAEPPYLQFEPFVPDEPAAIEALHSYTTLAPTSLGQKWQLEDGTIVEARMIKLDVHETRNLPPGEKRADIVAGISLGYQPICVQRGYLIAEKFLTQARGTVGVPDDRYQDLPKHLYDLDSLLLALDGIETLQGAARWLPTLIGEQGRQWKGDAGVESVMEDLETSLLNIAIIDYSDERQRYGNAIKRLETLYLPSGARMHLHRWATMAARALAIARLLRLILQGKENITQELHAQAKRLANEINRYPKPSQLAKILYERLPASIRQTRQLRGSPPERLFWLLIDWKNLNELEDIILGM